MKRVMLWLAISLAAGIAVYGCGVSASALYILFCFLGFLLFCIYKKEYKLVTVCTCAAAIGYMLTGFCAAELERDAAPFDKSRADICARVINTYTTEDYSYIDVKTTDVRTDTESSCKSRKIRVYLYEDSEIKYGDTVQFTAMLRSTADGNDRLKMLSKDIGLTTSIAPEEIEVTGSSINKLNPKDAAYAVRSFICERVDMYLSGNCAGLLRAMLTGDTTGMDDAAINFFRICGLSHITAVSGMHVSILVSIAMGVLGLFCIKMRRPAIIFYIILVWFFVLITGMGASAVRAAIMTTLMFTAFLIRRDSDSLGALSISVIVMLLVNPATLFDIGFQLSVLASAGIIFFFKPLQKTFSVFTRHIGNIMAVTVSAQLMTFPVMAYNFGMFSVFGVIANLIVCPLVPLVMALGILLVSFSSFTPVAFCIAFVLKWILNGIIALSAVISFAPYSTVNIHLTLPMFFAYAAFCVTLYLILVKSRRAAVYPALVALLITATIMTTSCFGTEATLTFLNVGSGDCAVLSAPRVTVMIDGGGSYDTDIGKKKVMPFLRKSGVSKVDAAFLTHCHLDHGQGFVPLLKDGMIKNIILPVGAEKTQLGRDIISAAQEGNAAVYYVSGGETLSFCGVEVKAVNTDNGDDENNGVVYYLRYGKKRVCFTGDITKEAEQELCKTSNDLCCDLLKIAHHGSDTSSDSNFLRAVGAKFAVISCAGEKKPSQETLNSLKNEGISYAVTKLNGNIEFKLSCEGFTGVQLERGTINEL